MADEYEIDFAVDRKAKIDSTIALQDYIKTIVDINILDNYDSGSDDEVPELVPNIKMME